MKKLHPKIKPRDPIWKNYAGKFLKVENITEREERILLWAGAKSYITEEEFKSL